MKLTNLAITQLQQALAWFDRTKRPVLDADKKLAGTEGVDPGWKITYALGRTSVAINAQGDVIEKARMAIVKAHASRDEKGALLDVMPGHPNHEKVIAEITDLMGQEVEISGHQFDPELLEKCVPTPPPTIIGYLSPLFLEKKP